MSTLHTALHKETTTELKSLLDWGGNVNARNEDGFAPLHLLASEFKRFAHRSDLGKLDKRRSRDVWLSLEMAELLFDHGADVDVRDEHNMTPLHLAARQGQINIAKLLLERGADVNAQAEHGLTPLYLAAYNGHPKTAALLLERGADVNARNAYGETPLHAAIVQGHSQTVELLLASDADVNARTNNGRTPLHSAAHEGHTEFANLLLEFGADVNAVDAYGDTPLRDAAARGHSQIADLMREHGVNQGRSSVSHELTDSEWSPEALLSLDPQQFEEITAEVWKQQGFMVQRTPLSGDGGIDVVAVRDDGLNAQRIAIQCKRHSNPVGRPDAQKLIGATSDDPKYSEAILVGVYGFTDQCKEFARTLGTLRLLDGEKLCQLLNDLNIPL